MFTNIANNEVKTNEKSGIVRRFLKFISMSVGVGLDVATTGDADERRALIQSLQDARVEWAEAVSNFEQVSEHDIVDYYIYRMKASQTRYQYFLRKAKELRLKMTV